MKREPGELLIKSITDTTAEMEGYGVVFGGRDLEGDYFEKDTDFMLDLVPVKPVTFNHAQKISDLVPPSLREITKKLPHIPDPIGLVGNKSLDIDDVGIWLEATIETSKEYLAFVKKAARRGVLGLSSSTAPALAIFNRDRKIMRWPIVEFAITPVPAEPRTLGLRQIKSLFDAAGLQMPETFNEALVAKVAQLRARAYLIQSGE